MSLREGAHWFNFTGGKSSSEKEWTRMQRFLFINTGCEEAGTVPTIAAK
jgi:hypothetical protein